MGILDFFSGLLDGPIGNNKDNHPDDVRKTKRNLKNAGYMDEDDQEMESPFITRRMDTGIKSFQRDNGLKVDGIMNPGGETERGLFEALTNRKADEIFGPPENDGGSVGFGGNASGALVAPRRKTRAPEGSFVFVPKSLGNKEDAAEDSAEDRYALSLNERRGVTQKESGPEPANPLATKPAQYDATGRMIRDDKAPENRANPSPSGKTNNDAFHQFRKNLAPREGGFVDDPTDRGGPTKKGVSQEFLDLLHKQNGGSDLPKNSKDLNDEQIDRVFKKDFFEQPKIDKLYDIAGEHKTGSKLVEHVFDAGVMSGPTNAGQWLQQAIDETIGSSLGKKTHSGKKEYDGNIGPKTRDALEKAIRDGKIKEISDSFADKRIEFLRRLPDYQSRKNGWERRVRELRD